MTVKEIISNFGLISDHTEVWIRNGGFRVLAHGNWYHDDVLGYLDNKVEAFTWQDDNKIYIDLPDEAE